MKKVYIYIAALVGLLSIISCTQREEVDFQEINVDKIFSAYMADDSITKTVIDGEIGDEYRKTLWLPGDSVGIASGYGKPVEKFVNTNTSASELALLEGSISSSGESYYAIYPYHSSLKMESGFFTFDIPANQKYQKNSFAPDAAPMVARLDTDNANQSLYFKNLCGVLIINLTGEEKVKSITFTGKNEAGENMKVSGKWSVDMTYTDTPIITPTDSSSTSVTLQCEDGVQLDPVIPTPFYIVLPPATYHTFSVSIITEDDKFMYKEGTKPLIIRKANITSSSALIFVETAGINLSAEGTANSYIVPNIGRRFIFDARVKGNSNETVGLPASAEVLWETKNTREEVDKGDIISSVLLMDDGFVSFTLPEKYTPGNAVIAIKDNKDIILWSWHIWVVDYNPNMENEIYPSKVMMMDRNLGALSNRVDVLSYGMLYQWGRKDPFVSNGGNNLAATTAPVDIIKMKNTSVEEEPIDYAQRYPYIMLYHQDWSDNVPDTLWNDKKSMYDPCPVGWSVPGQSYGVFDAKSSHHGYHQDGSCSWDDFITFLTYKQSVGYNIDGSDFWAYSSYWTSTPNLFFSEPKQAFTITEDVRPRLSLNTIRCKRESGLIIDNISSSVTERTAEIDFNVSSIGATSVLEYGVVFGYDSRLRVNVPASLATVVKGDEFTKEFGNLSVNIDGLRPNTSYIYRAYVIGNRGIEYGETYSFKTKTSGNNEGVGDEDYKW